MDPLLLIHATTKERHRLVKWRMHWLPPHPTPKCTYDNNSKGTRHHYTAECRHMEPIIIQLQIAMAHYNITPIPTHIPNINIIDHLINQIPTDHHKMQDPKSHWQRTWPLLLSALLTIDINSHPDATFAPKPTEHSWLKESPSSTSPNLDSPSD